MKEATIVLIAEISAESGSAFAVEHHQFGESGWFANSFFITGDPLFGFHDGRILIPQYVRPEPAVECFLVAFQNVLAQPKTDVKKVGLSWAA